MTFELIIHLPFLNHRSLQVPSIEHIIMPNTIRGKWEEDEEESRSIWVRNAGQDEGMYSFLD
jgi:hypothetical protein